MGKRPRTSGISVAKTPILPCPDGIVLGKRDTENRFAAGIQGGFHQLSYKIERPANAHHPGAHHAGSSPHTAAMGLLLLRDSSRAVGNHVEYSRVLETTVSHPRLIIMKNGSKRNAVTVCSQKPQTVSANSATIALFGVVNVAGRVGSKAKHQGSSTVFLLTVLGPLFCSTLLSR